MKRLSHFKIIFTVALISVFVACSSNDDSNTLDNDELSVGTTHFYLQVNGNAIQSLNSEKNYNIEKPVVDNGTTTTTTIVGYLSNEEADGGTVKVANLRFASYSSGNEDLDFIIALPAYVGTANLGEITTTSTGTINEYPTYYMLFHLNPQDVFYDSDNDNDNDIITPLLSKTITVTIIEYEEVYNSIGQLTIGHIKGTFGNVAYYKAYTGPTSDPQILDHTVTGHFEYNLPVE